MADEIAKTIIKQRKRMLRKLTLTLGNVKWTIAAIFVMSICFIISYFFRNTWISNVLISVGAGFVTGLVFYWLSNLRNNKILQLEKEIELLTPIYRDLENISNLQLLVRVRSMEQYTNKGQIDIAVEIMECIERLELSIHKLTFSLSEMIDLESENPFDYDSYQSFRKSYEEATSIDEYRKWSKFVCEKLRAITENVAGVYKEKKGSLEILQKIVF